MTSESLDAARTRIGRCVAEVQERGPRLSPLDLHARMDEIRKIASVNGMSALEQLARCSAQMALLPGHRVAVRSCLEHVDEAIACRSPADTTAMLAALALRLR
ncbi:hypothetical protein G7077_07665 [Sphingomonas piscis]|uniref:Uncharacterized protein n=1 Tax=Sphingomonas piscis TaxID=2714943 RepID=A0A6G7YPX6_9SPHN|nr:hypothetical protein [Sphingomonas piscis]QIK78791.1 hypothetical protein G7077_07665 [Sphingomonas piscis]